MSKIKRFTDVIKDISEIIVAAPVAIATSGGVLKFVGSSIAHPKVSNAVIKAGDLLLKGGKYLAKAYGKGAAIGAKALGSGAKSAVKAATPAVKTIATSIPGSKYVPAIIKYGPLVASAYGITAGAVKAAKEFETVRKLTGGAMDKLSSDRPKLTFQSVLNTLRDALLFK